jgi:hypothetical protein
MSELSSNAIHRSLGKLAVSIQRASDRKKMAAAAEGLAEVDQQFQIELQGLAGGLVWQTINVAFDDFFVDAPGQRDADLLEPHFTYGAVLDIGPPVMVTAHVSDWQTDAQGNFTGAAVRVGVWDPTVTAVESADLPRFGGRLHLNFQGFAAPNDPSDEEN